MDDAVYKIYEHGIGDVYVTEDVIAVIAGLAAVEVEGVAGLANKISNEIISKLGKKNLAAGVKVSCYEDTVSLSLAVVVEDKCNIPDVSKEVQEKVKSAIEGMTGLNVRTIDVEIAKIKIEK